MKSPGKIPCSIELENRLERLKNRFIAALYEHDADAAATALAAMGSLVVQSENGTKKKAVALLPLSETSEKLVNQTCQAWKKLAFHLPASNHLALNTVYRQIKQALTAGIRQARPADDRTGFTQWTALLGLDTVRQELLFKTAMTFQLTTGCSNFCRRCNEWALPRVRGHFTLQAVKQIMHCMAKQDNRHISLYGASDPLDWEDGGSTVADIVVAARKQGMETSLLTKLPRGKSLLLQELTDLNADLSVSVTSRNKRRVRQLENQLNKSFSKQHDTDDLLIPACLDEDFTSVKPSITDGYGTEITPDGAYIVIPTFTSALHPFGHKKIPVTPGTSFFPLKKTGRHALLVDYFKPLCGYNLKKERCWRETLLSVQVETLLLDSGEYELTPPGMRSVKEYLEIFDSTARVRRRKMSLSVLRKLKKAFVGNTPYQALSATEQKKYKARILRHLFLCKKEGCHTARIHTLSFFLKAVIRYLHRHPQNTAIIRFLTRNEFDTLTGTAAGNGATVEQMLSNDKKDSFLLFRQLALGLLFSSPFGKTATAFAERHPSQYDPLADLFAQKIELK